MPGDRGHEEIRRQGHERARQDADLRRLRRRSVEVGVLRSIQASEATAAVAAALPVISVGAAASPVGEGVAEEAAETRKASVRAKVEHPFLYVKRHFGYAKVRYRGVAKNRQRIALLLGFSNLLIAGRYATG